MTDPLEERLRAHLADRAGRVTAEPDPGAFVERSAGRARLGAGWIAGLAAAVVVLAGGGFATGMSVAGSSPAPAPTSRTAAGASPVAGGVMIPAGVSSSAGSPATALAPTMTWLVTRTTSSGVTVRAFVSGVATDPCPRSSACPPPVPVPVTCPAGAMCAQPIAVPATGAAVANGAATTSSGSTAGSSGTVAPGTTGGSPGATGGSSGSGSGSSGTTTTTVPTTTTTPSYGCQSVTVELSTDRAVATAVTARPTGVPPTGSLGVLAAGSFGSAEGGPADWVAADVGAQVAAVRLVSATGSVLDSMAPTDGLVVLANSGSDTLTGASLVALDAAGATTGTVPTYPQTATGGTAVCTVPTGAPVTTPTTVPGSPPSASTSGPVPPTVAPAVSRPPVGTATGSA